VGVDVQGRRSGAKATGRTGESRFLGFARNDRQRGESNDGASANVDAKANTGVLRCTQDDGEKRATAKAKEEADPCGMTARKAKAKAKAKTRARTTTKANTKSLASLQDDGILGDANEGKNKRRSRFPEGMTERKARAKATTNVDPCGMTNKKGSADD
jgi:hypothetical protein